MDVQRPEQRQNEEVESRTTCGSSVVFDGGFVEAAAGMPCHSWQEDDVEDRHYQQGASQPWAEHFRHFVTRCTRPSIVWASDSVQRSEMVARMACLIASAFGMTPEKKV